MTEDPPFWEDEASPKYSPFLGGRSLLEVLGRPIAFHRCLVDVGGSIASALLLSQAVHWQKWADKQSEREGWFYKTTADWMEETGLGRDEFQAARKKLVDIGILLYEVKGVPATGHYKVDVNALSLRIFRKLDYGISVNKNTEFPQSSVRNSRKQANSSTKNTSKNTANSGALKMLTDIGVDEQVAKDWLAVRKAKRAPLTASALKAIESEALKAGLTVPQAIKICAERSWQGFKAAWMDEHKGVMSSTMQGVHGLQRMREGLK